MQCMAKKPVRPAKKSLAVLPSADSMIHVVRGQKVMLDSDLAALYGVKTGNLNLAVKRHQNRFPHDFMFSLSDNELRNLILQSAISRLHGGRRKETIVMEKMERKQDRTLLISSTSFKPIRNVIARRAYPLRLYNQFRGAEAIHLSIKVSEKMDCFAASESSDNHLLSAPLAMTRGWVCATQ